jgi:hypothetical protein
VQEVAGLQADDVAAARRLRHDVPDRRAVADAGVPTVAG